MKNHLYLRLAVSNMRNNRRFYLPFLLTAAITVACFFIILSIVVNPGRPGGDTTRIILTFGVVVIALFALIFLFYTNSFLIKRRKKELGLYNILGMEKRHIAKVLVWESVISAVLSIGCGLLAGRLLFRLVLLLLLNMSHTELSFTADFSPFALLITVALFCSIFALLLLANLRHVAFSKPIELLRGGEVGEKEPKINWLLVVLGVLSLGSGYAIALTVKNVSSAIVLFFLAVLLVIIGTYCLFTSISIALLKFLKSRKRFYYKANHFVSISGMLYRMKQNAVGLANICILSTMVLVTIATTVSLYAGLNDIIDTLYPHDITCQFSYPTEDCRTEIETMLAETAGETGISPTRTTFYYNFTKNWTMDGENFLSVNSELIGDVSAYVCFMAAEDWESLTGQHYDLSGNEVALGEAAGSLSNSFSIMGESYTVSARITDLPGDAPLGTYTYDNLYYIIVPDMDTLLHIYDQYVAGDEWDGYSGLPDLALILELNGTDEQKEAFTNTLISHLMERSSSDADKIYQGLSYAPRAGNVRSLYDFYGGFLFIGVFFGALFLMATVLIIYYKQIIEGYDDRSHFEIMQKVGMDKRLISSSVRSQVLTMFLLPLAVAAMHLAFAFPLLKYVLLGMGLRNTGLFLACTVATFAVFTVVYLVVYLATARVYYKTVSEA